RVLRWARPPDPFRNRRCDAAWRGPNLVNRRSAPCRGEDTPRGLRSPKPRAARPYSRRVHFSGAMMLSVRKLRRQADMKLQAVLRCAWAICALALGLAAHAQEAAEALESDPPARVARLSLIEGEVSLAPAGSDEWAEAVLNRPLTSNDRLWVGADARAELQIGAASVHLD